MEKVPKNINIDNLKKIIKDKFDNVKDIHHIHVWSVDAINNCMTAHVSLNKDITQEEIITLKNDIKKLLKDNDIEHVTLEIEYNSEKCKNHDC